MSEITPVTHTEKVVAGQVNPVTHLEHVIAEYGGGDINEQLKAGTNIVIEPTADGKAKISASGEVSSEDTYAREEITAILDGTTIDSFGDVETALATKANTATTYTKTEVDTALSGKVDKETGKGLSTNDYTTAEKTKLGALAETKSIGTGLSLDSSTGELTATGGGSGGTTDYRDLSNKPQINSVTLSGNKSLSDLGITDTTYSFADSYDASTNKGATVATITNAINALDVTGASNIAASKTISAWSETDGKVSVSTQDIAIAGTQTTLTGYTSESPAKTDTITASDTVNSAIKKLDERSRADETNILSKIGASDYASQNTGGTVRVWTTTDGTDTILHIANEAPTP
jgi:hypothetical protein